MTVGKPCDDPRRAFGYESGPPHPGSESDYGDHLLPLLPYAVPGLDWKYGTQAASVWNLRIQILPGTPPSFAQLGSVKYGSNQIRSLVWATNGHSPANDVPKLRYQEHLRATNPEIIAYVSGLPHGNGIFTHCPPHHYFPFLPLGTWDSINTDTPGYLLSTSFMVKPFNKFLLHLSNSSLSPCIPYNFSYQMLIHKIYTRVLKWHPKYKLASTSLPCVPKCTFGNFFPVGPWWWPCCLVHVLRWRWGLAIWVLCHGKQGKHVENIFHAWGSHVQWAERKFFSWAFRKPVRSKFYNLTCYYSVRPIRRAFNHLDFLLHVNCLTVTPELRGISQNQELITRSLIWIASCLYGQPVPFLHCAT